MPDEFVNANLANLSQLNLWFPLIMLVFIPAITMGIWADERRQGTEELLMTMPLSAQQIVLGKYGASVGIYSVSLLFSAGSNLAILKFLGNPDIGLFLATYFGYWLIGLTMLAIAMVASFLTTQLTIAYIFGALLNIPLIALQWADAAPVSHQMATFLKSFSLNGLFESFGRGIVSFSNSLFFLLIPCVMIYCCVVLLNRRLWTAKHSLFFAGHYFFRTIFFLIAVFSLTGLLRLNNLGLDWTEEKLSSLSSETLEMIQEQKTDYPIIIEAYLSPEVPQELVQTRLNIISVLNEIKKKSPNEVFLDIFDIRPNTSDAWRLERQYDIRPKKVLFDSRGQVREDAIFLTIIFRCGPKSIVIPFMNRGLSVEYELVNAWVNIGNRPKKNLGILKTDAALLGRFDAYGNQIAPQWDIINELAKQYRIESVDPLQPIPNGKYDAILAVQPSSLNPEEMANFADSLRRGQSTVIFEDPYPLFVSDFLVGTKIAKPINPANPYPQPKGEINLVWAILGILFDSNVLWKNYNPYPKWAFLSEEFVFVDANPILYSEKANHSSSDPSSNSAVQSDNKSISGASITLDSFSEDEISVSSLEHILFAFVGSVSENPRAETKFFPLIRTEAAGTGKIEGIRPIGLRSFCQQRTEKNNIYHLACRIGGEVPKVFRLPETSENESKIPELNVVVVADIDLLTNGFFKLRELGVDSRTGVSFDFDNVTFVLNAIDQVAQDIKLISIRSRRPKHRTLTTIENATRSIRDQAAIDQIAFLKEFENERKQEEEKLNQKIQELVNRNQSDQKNFSNEESLELQSTLQASQQHLDRILDEKKQQYDRKVELSQREVAELIRQVQGRYKLFSVLFPPILPLLIGFVVFIYRKRQQRSFVR
ncbi:MAG: Gldg family protein [Planctomycetia bacterium]|nr:Gldg family protein [Planctomycetia bacterium]